MDSGNNEFLIACSHKILYFCCNFFHALRTYTSSGIRNNAIRTELVTAILHLQKSAALLTGLLSLQILKPEFHTIYVHDIRKLL